MHAVTVVGARCAHHVSLHIAAGGECCELDIVNSPDGLLEVLLQHAVELQALAGGDAERRVADFVAQVELGQQLIAGDAAAGDGCTDHETVELGLAACAIAASFGAALAVVLLVGAVMLQQVRIVFADKLVAVAQLFGDVAGEVVAGQLDGFDRAELFRMTVLGCVRHLSLPNR